MNRAAGMGRAAPPTFFVIADDKGLGPGEILATAENKALRDCGTNNLVLNEPKELGHNAAYDRMNRLKCR